MRPDDWFITEQRLGNSEQVWSLDRPEFNDRLSTALRKGPLKEHADVEAAMALARLVHDQLTAYGTGGGESMSDYEMAQALMALKAVTKRLGIKDFGVPFSNFSTFKGHWKANNGINSYGARRAMLEGWFEPLHAQLVQIEKNTLVGLATSVDPVPLTGWPRVEEEIHQLRQRFQVAANEHDYRALGTNLVGVLESLSAVVFHPSQLKEGETELPVQKSQARIDRYIEVKLPGKDNEALRAVARKANELAQSVKHSLSDRTKAGIAADSVLLLANILKRLEQEI